MQKVETKYHFITTNENDAPKYVCSGLCEKVYWEDKISPFSVLEIAKCESCDGQLKAVSRNNYKVIEFKITPQNTNQVIWKYLSQVKPEFISFAESNWGNK